MAEEETNTETLESVPVIDIAPLLNTSSSSHNEEEDTSKRYTCIQAIGQACKEWGFFYIQNHNILPQTITNFRSTMDEFFHLDQQILNKIRRDQNNSRGYFDDELTKNKRDWKCCFDFGAQNGSLDDQGLDGYNQWPLVNEHETFESFMKTYFLEMESLSKMLLCAICESLGLEPTILQHHFDGNHTSYLRLNYYPICHDPLNHMAIHHHTDAGALTILYQDDDVTSLQVNRDDKWYFISPKKDTFVINIGDMIQVWSNDEYKAPLHRVQANSSFERYSAPFFYNPSYDTDVKPLLLKVEGDFELSSASYEKEAKYNVLNWGEFRAKRFAGDYADVGEEVQISHYLIHNDKQ